MPERRIRHRFLRLVRGGKLKLNEDFSKEEFQDQYHFTYLINPLRFINEAKLQKEAEDAVNQRGKETPPATNEPIYGSQGGNNEEPPATKVATH